MEKFVIRKTIGGFVTVPSVPDCHPLLSLLHNNNEVSRLLKWETLEDGIRRIRSAASRHSITVRLCGSINTQPTVLLTQRPAKITPPMAYIFKGLDGCDAAHRGVADFYERFSDALATALASGDPFDTRQYSVKHESRTGRVSRQRRNGPILVETSAHMDDLSSLVDTAFWRAAGGNDYADSGHEALTKLGQADDEIESLFEEQGDFCETVHSNSQQTLRWNSSFARVQAALRACENDCETELEHSYQALVESCKMKIAELRSSTSCANCKHFSPGIPESSRHPADPDECAHPRFYALLTANKHFPFAYGCKRWESKESNHG